MGGVLLILQTRQLAFCPNELSNLFELSSPTLFHLPSTISQKVAKIAAAAERTEGSKDPFLPARRCNRIRNVNHLDLEGLTYTDTGSRSVFSKGVVYTNNTQAQVGEDDT
mgnify:CR=1 FL=1